MRLFLIRHGQSTGNVDESAYAKLQDHNVPLTPFGELQALEAGKFLRDYYASRPDIAEKKARVWFSPFRRTVQTKDKFIEGFGADKVSEAWEDYLLREQDFGIFSHIFNEKAQKKKFPAQYKKFKAAIEASGKFYARPPDGESRADVTQRVRIFEGTMMRDVARGHEDVIIIAHGVTNRALEMDFLHKGVEWFEKEPNPGNCDITLIEGSRETGYTATRIYQGILPPPVEEKPKPKNLLTRWFGLKL